MMVVNKNSGILTGTKEITAYLKITEKKLRYYRERYNKFPVRNEGGTLISHINALEKFFEQICWERKSEDPGHGK